MDQETGKFRKRCAMCPDKLKGIEGREKSNGRDIKRKAKRRKTEVEFAVSNMGLNAQSLHFKSEQCRGG